MEFNLGYEVRETRQMSCTMVDAGALSLLTPKDIAEGLNSRRFFLSPGRTAITNIDGIIVAYINSDESLCGADYNLPRDFTHET